MKNPHHARSRRATRTALQYRYLLTLNLAVFVGMLLLGVANFVLHEHYASTVMWLPAGLAFGMMLLKGTVVLPAIILGGAATILVITGDVSAATIFGFAGGGACVFGRLLVAPWNPKDGRWLRVHTLSRMLLAGVTSYMLAGVLMGPFAISELITHGNISTTMRPAATTHESRVSPPAHNSAAMVKAHDVSNGAEQQYVSALERLLMEAIGVILVTPVVLLFSQRRRGQVNSWRERWRSALATTIVLLGVALAIYSGFIEAKFGIVHTTLLVLPPAVWLALEHDVAYTLLTNLVVSAITWAGTSLGHGPFKDHSSGLLILVVVFAITALLIAASRAERKAAERTIHRLATEDALTGIPNRLSFTAQLRHALESARQYPRKVAVMFIDLDGFKQVNDTLGHQTGDLLLTEVSRRMRSCLRDDALLARFGGDEFVLMVDHVAESEAVSRIAQRLASQVSLPIDVGGCTCRVSCSIGISVFPDDATEVAELLMQADIAMYGVKAKGRNGHAFFSKNTPGADDSTQCDIVVPAVVLPQTDAGSQQSV